MPSDKIRSPAGEDTPLAQETVSAGEIFGVPVSMSNYYFAKRVAYMFPSPWGAGDLPVENREGIVWESLILHYEAFRRGIFPGEEDIENVANAILKSQRLDFTRSANPQEYQHWITESVGESIELFENQMKYLAQIQKIKDVMSDNLSIDLTDHDIEECFLAERNHVGGEAVIFDAYEQAESFGAKTKNRDDWEKAKLSGKYQVRPVGLMTLEAYIDLWGIPKEQIFGFHSMLEGSVSRPMPFGRQWCVYILLEKRDADLAELPDKKEYYRNKAGFKKKHKVLIDWIEQLKELSRLKIIIGSAEDN